jgi:phage terminase small subunit
MTPKQEQFVQAYLLDPNATKAAIAAGYSPKTAQEQGSRLLSNVMVAEAIAKAQTERAERVEVTADEILRELKRIGLGNARDVMSWGPDGVRLKPSSQLTEDQAATVAEASQSITQHGGSIKLKMHDKVAALTLMGKHLGMFTDRVDLTTGGQPFKALIGVDIEAL